MHPKALRYSLFRKGNSPRKNTSDVRRSACVEGRTQEAWDSLLYFVEGLEESGSEELQEKASKSSVARPIWPQFLCRGKGPR